MWLQWSINEGHVWHICLLPVPVPAPVRVTPPQYQRWCLHWQFMSNPFWVDQPRVTVITLMLVITSWWCPSPCWESCPDHTAMTVQHTFICEPNQATHSCFICNQGRIFMFVHLFFSVIAVHRQEKHWEFISILILQEVADHSIGYRLDSIFNNSSQWRLQWSMATDCSVLSAWSYSKMKIPLIEHALGCSIIRNICLLFYTQIYIIKFSEDFQIDSIHISKPTHLSLVSRNGFEGIVPLENWGFEGIKPH